MANSLKGTSFLRRSRECDVLQNYTADLNRVIKDSADDMQTVLGVSNYQKVGELLGVVDSRLQTSSSEDVGKKFMIFLSILSNSFDLKDIAKRMKADCYGSEQPPSVDPIINPAEQKGEEKLFLLLRQKKVNADDIEKLNKNGVTWEVFLEMSEENIDSGELGITFGGRVLLKKLLKDLKSAGPGIRGDGELAKSSSGASNSGGINPGSTPAGYSVRIESDSTTSPINSKALVLKERDSTSSVTHILHGDLNSVENLFPSNRWNLNNLHSQLGVRGSNTRIAVLDSGVFAEHRSLRDKVKDKVFNYVPDGCITGAYPDYAHGTCVAAIIGGQSYEYIEKGKSIKIPNGVAPDCELFVCRVTSGKKDFYLENVFDSLLAMENLDIVCMSFSVDQNVYDAIMNHLQRLRDKDVVCIAAAGNEGEYQPEPGFPARDPNVLSVGALKPQGRKSDINPSSGIHVYAHGEEVIVPSVDYEFGLIQATGTSFAAPMVAGFLSLLFQLLKNPNLYTSDEDVQQKIEYVTKKFHDLEFLKKLFEFCEDLCKDKQLLFVQDFLQKIYHGGENYLGNLITYIESCKPVADVAV